jgi:pimeloyl-ACP methyl ester carboxylesterase
MNDQPVVLLHGLATSAAATWAETGWLDLLTDEGRNAVALDLPGHGATPPLSDWDHLEDWVAQRLPDGRIDAVGFSLGARILLTLAARIPERFDRLVVAGVGANLFRTDDHTVLRRGLASQDHDGAANPIVHHFSQLASNHGADLTAVLALLERRWPPIDFDRVSADVLVVLGEDDFAGPADPLLEALGPRARLVSLPRVDHFATPKSMGFLDAGLAFLRGGNHLRS